MYEYTSRKRSGISEKKTPASSVPKGGGTIPNSAMADVLAGRTHASTQMMGHREELAPSLAAKMSRAFGMDLSGMQVYHTDAMAGTDTKGLARGNKIVLSRDINLNTLAGQAVLGHEISHLHAQSQGLGLGHTGLYNNAFLEDKADAEGLRAARGQSILGESTGMNMGQGMDGLGGLTPVGFGMSASAGAPMQASGKRKKGKTKKKADSKPEYQLKTETDNVAKPEILTPYSATPESVTPDFVSPENATQKKEINGVDFVNSIKFFDKKNDKKLGYGKDEGSYRVGVQKRAYNKKNQLEKLKKNVNLSASHLEFSKEIDKTGSGKQMKIDGWGLARLPNNLNSEMSSEYSDEYISEMFKNMYGKGENEEGSSLDPKYDEKKRKGVLMYKDMLYKQLKRLEKTYGTTLEQMDPEDALNRFGDKTFVHDIGIMQDVEQMYQKSTPEAVRNYIGIDDGSEENEDFKKLGTYYSWVFNRLSRYRDLKGVYKRNKTEKKPVDSKQADLNEALDSVEDFENLEKRPSGTINGPSMSPKQKEEYDKYIAEQRKKKKLMPSLENLRELEY